MIKVEHTIDTDELIEREMTDEEIGAYNADMENIEAEKLNQETIAAEKQAKKLAVLAKLGLTADEAEALI